MNEDILEDILRQEFPERDLSNLEDVSGLNKITYSVRLDSGRNLIVSWVDDQEKIEDFKIEAAVIELVDSSTSISVPEVITLNFTDERLPPYYLMEKIDGYNPDDRFKYMPENVKKFLLKEAGRILGRVHEETNFETVGNFYHTEQGLKLEEKEVWSDALFDSMGHHLSGLEDTVFGSIIDEAENAFENHRHLVDDTDFEPVLVHEDFRPGNLIVKDNEIKAVIDWERALVGHSEYDLFKAERDFIDLKFRTEKTREKYRGCLIDGYREIRELEEGWERRREFYRFIHILQDLRVFADKHSEWIDDPEEIEKAVEHFKKKLRDQIQQLKEIEQK